ncbi:MAG: MBL fold metallo-hydrolase [Lachnospiraceae bacterium]|nr:MBL fold metallo-hydrolase [Lachnospiraceae bacterium]
MKTKLTVIVDNKPDKGLQGEWGLCILCEYGDKKILLDAGASDLFAKNMKMLGLDIKDVDYAVLSHAHYDHANGMPEFFKENDKAKFYLRESTGENCYARKTFLKFITFKKYIGIPRHVTGSYPDRIEYVSGDYELCDGAYLIPHKTPDLYKIGERELMFVRTKEGWKPDDFSHEQSLVLDTDKGLVILNSCSHGGAVNIINEVKSTFPDKKIYGLIGGFHLFNKSNDEIKTVAENILDTGIEYVCTGHCTKDRAYGIMKEVLNDRLTQLKAGLEMEF